MKQLEQRISKTEKVVAERRSVPAESEEPAQDQMHLTTPSDMHAALESAARLVYNDNQSNGVTKARALMSLVAAEIKIKPLREAEAREEVDWEKRFKYQDAAFEVCSNNPQTHHMANEYLTLHFALTKLVASQIAQMEQPGVDPGSETLSQFDVAAALLDEFFTYLREKYGNNVLPTENEPAHD